ncbi:MAG: hypothetical protein CMH22_01025 [Methylophaga sp.]|nr:hypothetical protein [Methylophaga sp.]|tara:strand:- start:157 stop:753 length:597 start_codon:yes stop_codon:yes gene_type:complete
MGCLTDKITDDIAINCDNIAIAGLESDILLIPHSDVDKSASTIDATNKMIITDLVLKAGATGYLLEGVKQTNGMNSEFIPGDDQTLDKHRHGIRGRVLTPSAANIEQANLLGKGESYMAVVNRKYKGADSADAFLILGWDTGMHLSVMTINSNENDGAILLEMASKDGMLENDLPRVVLDTDYDTTLTAFNNKFEAQP